MTDGMLGRRALVVGASAGIGREVGLRLAALGAQVVFHGRRRDKLEEAVERAGSGFAVVADLCDPEGCESLVSEAADRLGGIDLIVHAASLSGLSLVRDTPAREWARVYAVNVVSAAMVVREALPRLSAHAVAAFLSSESVGAPYHGLIPYTSSKAALEEVVRGLRLEHPEHRFACIRVGQTAPTDFTRDFPPELAQELSAKWIAIGRIHAQSMDVEELGRAIADSLAVAVTTPTVEFQDMVLRPPGGFLGDGGDVLGDTADLGEVAQQAAYRART